MTKRRRTRKIDKYLGRAIRHYRLDLDWTLGDMACRSGINATSIPRAERAPTVSWDILHRCADAFGVTPEAIIARARKLQEEDEMQNKSKAA